MRLFVTLTNTRKVNWFAWVCFFVVAGMAPTYDLVLVVELAVFVVAVPDFAILAAVWIYGVRVGFQQRDDVFSHDLSCASRMSRICGRTVALAWMRSISFLVPGSILP